MGALRSYTVPTVQYRENKIKKGDDNMLLPLNNPLAFGKFLIWIASLLLAAVGLVCPLRANAQATDAKTADVTFTAKDREAALKFFNDSRSEFVAAISGLSDEQLSFKAGPDRWSIAQVAEHIITAENLIYSLITEKIVKAPAPTNKDVFRFQDTAIALTITNRSTKLNAPQAIQPNGRWKSAAELILNFESTRNKTIKYTRTTNVDLRNRFGENPALGMIDGYQWLVFLNAHGLRHLAQIEEVKADSRFPRK